MFSCSFRNQAGKTPHGSSNCEFYHAGHVTVVTGEGYFLADFTQESVAVMLLVQQKNCFELIVKSVCPVFGNSKRTWPWCSAVKEKR